VIIDAFVTGTANTSYDKVKVKFEDNIDCERNVVIGTYVENAYSYNSAKGTLQCNGNGNTATTRDIVEGVDAIRILYGLDDDGDKIADRYVSAATVDAIPNAWRDDVSSIRIGLLMNSVTNVKQNAASETHQLLDTSVTVNDRLLHKVFTTTILLRNRMS
jgi:hypothetical protein